MATNVREATLMNDTPNSSAVHPARAAPAASPRPIACPTRTAPADARPSGTMKLNPARLSAIWCAASDAGNIRPASADPAANTPTSRVS